MKYDQMFREKKIETKMFQILLFDDVVTDDLYLSLVIQHFRIILNKLLLD